MCAECEECGCGIPEDHHCPDCGDEDCDGSCEVAPAPTRRLPTRDTLSLASFVATVRR